ncbi:MAG: hypothetical protein IT306_17490 [Chloroflexi bacterium]|nr:hypothetical protein [Chloroflexota bacterium]
MIENKVWSHAGGWRVRGLDLSGDEPSHIHLPRRRRFVGQDEQGHAGARGACAGDHERRAHGVSSADEA